MPEEKSVKSRPTERVVKVYTKPTGEVHVKFTGRNRKTADAVWAALPFESNAERWGDEVYFKIPVKFGEENAQTVVEVGDVAYWSPGTSMCIFFGSTPVSEADEPRAYSPVNVFGKVIGDPMIFKKVGSGEKIRVEPGQ
nr:cyclophilin-like fold protein [Candidatus Njordarchaeum guaymaensis]